MASPVNVEIDTARVERLMSSIRDHLTAEKYKKVMRSEFHSRVVPPVKRILGEDIPQEYAVNKKEVKRAVGHERMGDLGSGVVCTIPISGMQRKIGPKGYSASGSLPGWKSLKKKYRVKATILSSGKSTLPKTLKNHGSMKPFRNSTAPRLNKITFSREGKARLPIKPIVGISIPQMPLNRSRERLERDIGEVLEKRMQHVHEKVLEGVIRG